MREIKFRAWANNKNDFLGYSEYAIYPHSGEVAEMVSYDVYSDKLSVNHEAVLEQFTGLHDKNGKEIYEGDIVSVDSSVGKLCGTVVYENYYFTVRGFYNSTFDYPYMAFSEGDYEVIGNIHENKELLDEKV